MLSHIKSPWLRRAALLASVVPVVVSVILVVAYGAVWGVLREIPEAFATVWKGDPQ